MLLLHVDAFTSHPFRGNPAAVCLLDKEQDERWMQNVAAEMNLSETAFLMPRDDGFLLRWFTPAVEVALCGHATLASAHVLWEEELWPSEDPIPFHTKSGVLTATLDRDVIELDFPATPETDCDPPPGLLESLGVTDALHVGRNKFDYLVEVASEEIVRSLDPDHALLRKVEARGVIVTSRAASTTAADFVSRFFAPGSGVDEDPVTGSAHCCLAPYWSAKLGKDELTGFQASRRGGYVRVRQSGERVKLGGKAVTILRGTLVA
jgi:PhzF family phenazine biosynthesis protein